MLSLHGAAFSLEPILTQSAWFRPHNQSEDIRNLLLCGAGTHPGAGMPGVLCSARIVDRLVPFCFAPHPDQGVEKIINGLSFFRHATYSL